MARIRTVHALLLTMLLVGSCLDTAVPLTETASPVVIISPTPDEILSAPTTPVSTPEEVVSAPTAPVSTLVAEKKLVLCVVSGVSPIYRYYGTWWTQEEFLAAVAPPAIAVHGFEYQPTILEKIPNLLDGDAMIEAVTVRDGDMIINDAGDVSRLEAGIVYRPSGCREYACAQTYESGEVQMDRMVVTFQLLPNLKWSDGAPLTARDSAFAYQVVRSPDFQGSAWPDLGLPEGAVPGTLERTDEYTVADEHSVRWVGLPGYITPWYFLNFMAPLPAHLLEYRSPGEIAALDPHQFGMVGWGPFMVGEWSEREYVRLVRNPHYYRSREGLPHLDEVIIRYIHPGQGHALADVLTSECDIADNDSLTQGSRAWAYPTYLGIQEIDKLRVVVMPGLWDGIAFRLATPPEHSGLLADPQLRQAIAYGTDRQAIADAVIGDTSLVADDYVPSLHPLYAGNSLVHYPFSPQHARELLVEAGWQDTDSDGILDKDGALLTLTLLVSRSRFRAPGVAVFQQNMADIGIQIQIRFTESKMLYASDGPIAKRSFDLYWSTWPTIAQEEGGLQPTCGAFFSWAVPDPEQLGESGYLNVMGYDNQEFDAACLLGLVSLNSEETERGHLLAQQIFSQDLPILPLYFYPLAALAQPKVTGLQIDAHGRITGFETLDILSSP